jgi:hypothetical protein
VHRLPAPAGPQLAGDGFGTGDGLGTGDGRDLGTGDGRDLGDGSDRSDFGTGDGDGRDLGNGSDRSDFGTGDGSDAELGTGRGAGIGNGAGARAFPVKRQWSRRRGFPQRVLARLALSGALAGATLGLAACSSGSASASARVGQWVSSEGFGSSVGTLLGDGGRVIRSVELRQSAGALRADCGVLEDDASTAAGNLPTPDQNLTDTLQRAYRTDLAAAAACYGASPADRRRLDQALEDVTSADALLEQAVQQVSEVTGRVPSTTATTP